MDEMDLLDVFYTEMKFSGLKHDQIFINLDEELVLFLQDTYGHDLHLSDVQRLADICIANEWIERTTADRGYNYLSLTEEGLEMIRKHKFKDELP